MRLNRRKRYKPQKIVNVPYSSDNEEMQDNKVSIKTSKVMGRYMVAGEKFNKGEIILSEPPLVVGPNSDCDVSCLGCYKNLYSDKPYIRCKNCGWPLCRPNCRGIGKLHGHTAKECSVLTECKSNLMLNYKDFQELSFEFQAIVPLRCLLLKSTNTDAYNHLLTMEHHSEIRKTIPEIWDVNQKYVVDKIRGRWQLTQYTEEEIHTICGILEVNAFEIGHNGSSVRGLYPTAFLMSHNCVPNTNHIDNDKTYNLTVRASMEIPKNHPITLSYAHTLHGTLKRRTHLLNNKFFECKCEKCADPTELGTYMSALHCPKCKNGWILQVNPLDSESDWICNNKEINPELRCPGYKVSAKSMNLLIDKISTEVDELDCNDIEAIELFLKRYINVLHPTHYINFGLKISLSQLYGKTTGYIISDLSMEKLERKQMICEEVLNILNVIEPGYTRIRGVTLYELHAPIMVKISRSYPTGAMQRSELRRLLKQVLKYLEEAATILDYEPESSSEYVLGVAAKEALLRIKDWEKIIGKF